MKIQKIIAIAFLALYGLVLSHNFVPHHHHSLTDVVVEHCHHDEDHHHHHESDSEHTKVHCSFEDVIVLRDKINLSELYSYTASFDIVLPVGEELILTDNYILPHIQEPRCRDVQLRGPPHFS